MIPIRVEIDFRLVEHGSTEYMEVIKLREEVLRRPLGLTYTNADIAAEADQLHFVGYVDVILSLAPCCNGQL